MRVFGSIWLGQDLVVDFRHFIVLLLFLPNKVGS